jgi:uncharacterized protein
MAASLNIRVLSSISAIASAQWDNLVVDGDACGAPTGQLANPFMSHAFLSALEDSGSATARSGWMPQHLILEEVGSPPVGALPCYLKSHSQGEYVFDHGWADAFEQAGGQYYPKLQCSVPFTPATGPRLLARPGAHAETRRLALLKGLEALADGNRISSAHITFLPESEARIARQAGYLIRNDTQFHWRNKGYRSFNDFLDQLSSRKRKNIRKERNEALERKGIAIDWLTGSDLTEAVWDRFFEFYIETGSRKWGRPYLNREFYSRIGQAMAERIVLIMAKRNGRYIAGAINFASHDCLYGRHWGCVEHHDCLHFEVCYYQAIDYAIATGLKRVEAGAQGAHKLARGYIPETTWSAHWIGHPRLRQAVAEYLCHEREHVAMAGEALKAHAPFRKDN